MDRAAAGMPAAGVGGQILTHPEHEARDALERNDRARVAYVRHFYGADPARAEHYHLVLDSTRVPLDTCTEIIVAAAEACRRQ